MKKFYVLFAASLLAGSMMAAPVQKKTGKVEKFDVKKSALVEQAHYETVNGIGTENYVMKSQKADGANYLVRVKKNDRTFPELVVADYTFDQAPYYWFTMSFDNMAQNANIAVYDFILPCVAVLDHDEDQDWWVGSGENQMFNWDKAAEVYGSKEAAQAAPSLAQMSEALKGFYMGVIGYGYLGVYQCWTYNESTWAGKAQYYLKPAVEGSDGKWNYDGASKLYLSSYNEDTDQLTVGFDATIGTKVGAAGEETFGQAVGTMVSDNVVAEPLITGWAPNDMEIGEVHFFNLGSAPDYKFMYGQTSPKQYQLGGSKANCLYENYEPSQLYYVVFCDPELTFDGQYGEADLPAVPKGNNPAVDQVNWFRAYMTLEANDDPENVNPKGVGVLSIDNYRADNYGYLAATLKGGMIFGSYYLKACNDSQVLAGGLGSLGQFYGELAVPYSRQDKKGVVTETSEIGIGDPEKGFYGRIITDAGATVEFSHKGTVMYHYDMDDYNAVKEISATGAVKGVGVDSETVATDYYNFQGIRLNGAPEKGIYIVREYKADGTVVSRKVAK